MSPMSRMVHPSKFFTLRIFICIRILGNFPIFITFNSFVILT